MAALLTYRSRDSFESRFGRNIPDPSRRQNINGGRTSPAIGKTGNEHFAIHNDGHKHAGSPRPSRGGLSVSNSTSSLQQARLDPEFHNAPETLTPPQSAQRLDRTRTPTYFSAQSYLRYQGDKFITRFDANCYIAITRKLDTHDVSRNRDLKTEKPEDELSSAEALHAALAQISQPTLILGIQSDGLFTFAEQEELAAGIPNSVLKTIDSSEGHDAFLLEFEQVNNHLIKFMKENLTDIMTRTPISEEEVGGLEEEEPKKSVISEVDDITAW
jgi:homoserine O-acetyltransferase/O-succinyltransferase